jgi:hypothetical protein
MLTDTLIPKIKPSGKRWPETPETERALMQNIKAVARMIQLENERLKAIHHPKPLDFRTLCETQLRYLELYINPASLASVRHRDIIQMGLHILHNFIRGGQGVLFPNGPMLTFVPWPPAILDNTKGLLALLVRALEQSDPDLRTPLADDTITLAD